MGRFGLSKSALFMTVAVCAAAVSSPGWAQTRTFDLPAQDAVTGIPAFAQQAGVQILVSEAAVRGKRTAAVKGDMAVSAALARLLAGTGLEVASNDGRTIALHAAAEPLHESSAAAPPLPVDQVVVTGTNIRGAAPAGAPVYTYSQAEISKSGVGSVTEFLQTLPQNFQSNGPATFDSIGGDTQNTQAATSVNLRGVGTAATLVLLNGQRPAPSVFGNFVDVSAIPLSAIQRIDVMPDGASAIYGSDAVAGVVNFVLKNDYEGAETRVRNGWVSDSGAERFQASQTIGHAWSSGNALVSLSYENDTALPASDRKYAVFAGPFDLEPQKTSIDLLVSGHQDITNTLSAHVDALYYYPTTDSTFSLSTVPKEIERTRTPQYTVNTALTQKLPADWSGEFDLSAAGMHQSADNRPVGKAEQTSSSDANVDSIGLKFDGPLFMLPAGEIKGAVGAGYRIEDYSNTISTYTASGYKPNTLNRTVSDEYAELNVPIVDPAKHIPFLERLSLSLAVRHEDYSDAGGATNPKVGASWQITEDLEIRGTYSTSFNVAKFSQTWTQFDTLLISATKCPSGPCTVATYYGSQADYLPETASTVNVGFNYKPRFFPGFKLSFDYYNIDYKNILGTPPAQSVLLANPGAFGGVVTANPSASTLQTLCARAPTCLNLAGSLNNVAYFIDNRTTNLANEKTDGIDLTLSYSTALEGGLLNAGLNLAHALHFTNQLTLVSPSVAADDVTGHPTSTRLRANLGFFRSGVSLNGYLNYVNGYVDNSVTPSVPVKSWTTLDLAAQIDLARVAGARAQGLTMIVALQNALNKAPPFVALPTYKFGFDANNANPDGRVVSLELRKQW